MNRFLITAMLVAIGAPSGLGQERVKVRRFEVTDIKTTLDLSQCAVKSEKGSAYKFETVFDQASGDDLDLCDLMIEWKLSPKQSDPKVLVKKIVEAGAKRTSSERPPIVTEFIAGKCNNFLGGRRKFGILDLNARSRYEITLVYEGESDSDITVGVWAKFLSDGRSNVTDDSVLLSNTGAVPVAQ